MDWLGAGAPTADEIRARELIAAGTAHIKTIVETGGQILGTAPLPDNATAFTADSDALSTWGFKFIERLAEHKILGGSAD